MQIKSATFGQLQNNCYLVTDEASGRSALVDCTEYSDKMKDFIGDAKLDYILLTHGHFDHIGGVAAVKAATGAKVVISAEDAPMLTSSRKSLAAFSFLSQAPAQADILVQDGDTVIFMSFRPDRARQMTSTQFFQYRWLANMSLNVHAWPTSPQTTA